jgi:hypothetical protein
VARPAEVVLLAILSLLSGAIAAPSEPVLAVPTEPIVGGRLVSVHVTAPRTGRAWVDGCEPIELERKVGEAWSAVPPQPCVKAPPAASIDKELTLTLPTPQPGEYRAVLAYGVGCTDGFPLALASCKKVAFVRSASFSVQ